MRTGLVMFRFVSAGFHRAKSLIRESIESFRAAICALCWGRWPFAIASEASKSSPSWAILS